MGLLWVNFCASSNINLSLGDDDVNDSDMMHRDLHERSVRVFARCVRGVRPAHRGNAPLGRCATHSVSRLLSQSFTPMHCCRLDGRRWPTPTELKATKGTVHARPNRARQNDCSASVCMGACIGVGTQTRAIHAACPNRELDLASCVVKGWLHRSSGLALQGAQRSGQANAGHLLVNFLLLQAVRWQISAEPMTLPRSGA